MEEEREKEILKERVRKRETGRKKERQTGRHTYREREGESSMLGKAARIFYIDPEFFFLIMVI